MMGHTVRLICLDPDHCRTMTRNVTTPANVTVPGVVINDDGSMRIDIRADWFCGRQHVQSVCAAAVPCCHWAAGACQSSVSESVVTVSGTPGDPSSMTCATHPMSVSPPPATANAPAVPVPPGSAIVVLGDSWASYDRTGEFAAVIGARGGVTVRNIAVPGTTCTDWATTRRTELITAVRDPNVRWAWLICGGNDVMAKMQSGVCSPTDLDGCFAGIKADYRRVVELVHSTNPGVRVAGFGYEITPMRSGAGRLGSWAMKNAIFPGRAQSLVDDVDRELPYFNAADLRGALQAAGGVAGAAVGRPVMSTGSPDQYYADTMHPSPAGYRVVFTAWWDRYWCREFRTPSQCAGASPAAPVPTPVRPATPAGTGTLVVSQDDDNSGFPIAGIVIGAAIVVAAAFAVAVASRAQKRKLSKNENERNAYSPPVLSTGAVAAGPQRPGEGQGMGEGNPSFSRPNTAPRSTPPQRTLRRGSSDPSAVSASSNGHNPLKGVFPGGRGTPPRPTPPAHISPIGSLSPDGYYPGSGKNSQPPAPRTAARVTASGNI